MKDVKELIEGTLKLAEEVERNFITRTIISAREKGFDDNSIAAILELPVEDLDIFTENDEYPVD